MRRLKFINLKGLNIYDSLLFEEILLRKSTDNWFIYNFGSARSIVVGFSGKIPSLVDVHKVHTQNDIKVIRRYTGGGTVIVDDNTIFTTFIMNANEAETKPYPRDIMTWSSNYFFDPVFQQLLNNSGSRFQLREHDYAIDDKKIGGNAQSIIKDRWVHHTSFLWDFTKENMSYLKIPEKRPEYRRNRDHHEFITSLKLYIPSPDMFEHHIIQQLQQHYDIDVIDTQHRHELMQSLVGSQPLDEIIRTKLEDISEFINSDTKVPSLVKMGPSCVNL